MEQKVEEVNQILELLQELREGPRRLSLKTAWLDQHLCAMSTRVDSLTVKATQLIAKLTALLSDLAVALTDRNKDSGSTIRLLVSQVRMQVEDTRRAIYPLTFKTDANDMVKG